MTEKEILKKDIEIELELFKIYSLFLVGLITGVAGLLLKNDNGNPFTKGLLFIGIFFLLSMGIIFLRSFFKIRKLRKQFKK